MPHYLKFVPRSQALNNMGAKYKGITFDTPQELHAFMALEKGSAAPRTRSELQGAALAEVRRQLTSERTTRAPSRGAASHGRSSTVAFVVKPEDANKPVSDGQGKMIAAAIGGLEVLCGGKEAKEAARAAGVYSSHILSQMGLTYGKASDVLSAMDKAGVKGFNQSNPTAAAAAQAILFNIGGISCPGRARANRGGRGRSR